MKTKFFITLNLLLGLLFYSCESSESPSNKNESLKLSSKLTTEKTINGEVEFQCIGSCNCGFGLDLNTMTGSCSCSPCALELKFKTISGNKLSEEDGEILKENLFKSELLAISLEDVKKYALEKYDTEISNFKKLNLYHNDGTYVVIFTFEDNVGKLQSVLYSSSKTLGKAFRVDCTGSCDCREQFNFNTNTASCSCSDCTMTVTEIKELTAN